MARRFSRESFGVRNRSPWRRMFADAVHQFHENDLFSSADRKSTRLNSSHGYISYAGFCLKTKTLGLGLQDDLMHRACIAAVKAAGDARRLDDLQDRVVVADGVGTPAFPHVRVEIDDSVHV